MKPANLIDSISLNNREGKIVLRAVDIAEDRRPVVGAWVEEPEPDKELLLAYKQVEQDKKQELLVLSDRRRLEESEQLRVYW